MRLPALRSLVGAVTTAALVSSGVAVAAGAPRPEPIAVVELGAWAEAPTSDGLTRVVVTLGAPGGGALGTAVSGSRVPAFLLRDAAPALPQLDPAKLGRARAELGEGGQLVPGEVDGAAVTLYLVGDGARVVSTGPAWAVLAASTTPAAASAAPAVSAVPAVPAPGVPVPAVVEPEPAAAAAPDAGADAPAPDPAALEALRAAPGVRTVLVLADGRVHLTGTLTPAQVADLPGVAAVEVSPQVPLLDVPPPGDPLLGTYGWHLANTGANAHQQPARAGADVDALSGWEAGTGAGAVIAVADSGYDTDHPDLAGALWTNPAEPCGTADVDGNGLRGDCHGWNFVTGSADLDNGPGGSHGAAVAGVAAARAGNGLGTAGLAPQASVMPLVIGSGSTVDVYLGAQAIRYAADHGADVVNASWGGGVSGPPLDALRSAVTYAGERGVLVVAAAGNDAADRDRTPTYPASLTNANLVSVGSSTATDTMAGHSAYGAASVDLHAPGQNVVTTGNDGGYRVVSGTSFAAPLTAAAVALLRAARPELGVADLKAQLLQGAEPVPALAGRSVTGARLDVAFLADSAVRYTFAGLGPQPGGRPVSARITAFADLPVAEHAVRLHLLLRDAQGVWAVADHPVTLDGATATTADDGSVTFPLGRRAITPGTVVAPSFTLPDGSYGLAVELLADGAPVAAPRLAPLTVTTPATAAPPVRPTSPAATPTAAPTTAPTTAPTAGPTSGPTAGPTTAPGTRPTAVPTTGPTSAPTASPTATSTRPATAAPTSTTAAPRPAPTAGPTPAPAPPTATTTSPLPAPSATAVAPRPSSSPAPAPSSTTTRPPTAAPVPAPTPAPTRTYPGTDPFGITEVSPSTLTTAGGRVRITGRDLEPDVRVRIGDTTPASVVSYASGATADAVTIMVPPLVAGTYDLLVSTVDGRSALLDDALTITGATASPSPGAPGTAPTTAPTPAPGGSTGPGGSSPSSPAPRPSPSPTPSGPTPAPGEPVVRTGPGGLRLVAASARWSAVPGAAWTAGGCDSGCTGTVV